MNREAGNESENRSLSLADEASRENFIATLVGIECYAPIAMKLHHTLLATVILTLLSSCYVGPVRPRVAYAARPGGAVVVPVGARPYHYRGVRYYSHRGVWYRPYRGGHVVCPRPF